MGADGVFGDSPERYVGAAWMDDDLAIQAQKRVAHVVSMKLPTTDLIWVGLVTALLVSVFTRVVGAQYLHRRMSVKPALLLRGLG